MSTPAPAHTADSAWTSLEPYAQLLRALMPRMSSPERVQCPRRAALVDRDGGRIPSSRIDLPRPCAPPSRCRGDRRSRRCSATIRPTFLAAPRRYRGGQRRAVRVVAIGFARPGGEAERRAFSFCTALVKPAIECLRRELMARDEILELHNSLLEQDGDLEMLLSVSGGGKDQRPEATGDLKGS